MYSCILDLIYSQNLNKASNNFFKMFFFFFLHVTIFLYYTSTFVPWQKYNKDISLTKQLNTCGVTGNQIDSSHVLFHMKILHNHTHFLLYFMHMI